MLCLFIFWELFGPSGVRIRTNTEVRLALPSAKPSLPRGLLRGKPPNVPKNRQCFFEKNFVSKFLVYLERADARRKRLGNGIGRAVGPPTPPGYSIPTHLPTPRPFVNANFLVETYLRRIREHGSKVEKMRARTRKASIGHTVDLY